MNEFLEQPIGKLYARFLPSSIISLLLVCVASLIDTIVISHFLGPVAMSAANICMPIFSSLIAISMLIVGGASTLYGHCIGKNDRKGADRFFTLATVIVVVIGLIYTICGLVWTDEVIRFLGANDAIFEMSKEYGRIVFYFALAYILFPLIQVFIRIDMDPELTVVGIVACGVLNAALDILLVGPYLKPGGFGMAGAAFATCISYAVGISLMCIHFFRKKNTLRLVRKFFSFRALGRVILSGIPGSITMLGNAVTVIVFNNIIISGSGRAGELYVAVYSVIVQVMTVAMAIYIGVAQCAQPMMAENYGAKLKDRLKNIFTQGVKITVIGNTIFAIILFFAAKWIAGVFSLDKGAADMIGVSVIAIRWFAASLIFTGINQMVLYLLQSTNDLVRSSLISVLSGTILMIVGIYLFDSWLLRGDANGTGIWVTFLFAQGVTLILSIIFYNCRKKHIFG